MRSLLALPAALFALALVPAAALGHAERATHFVDPSKGSRPAIRNSGPYKVVCKPESARKVKRSWAGRSGKHVKQRRKLARLLKKCRYRHIQQAVDAARTGDRILIMPGVYREEPSRKIPVKDPKCAGDEYWEPSGDNHTEDGRVPTYKHQVDCPNSRNLIAIVGDSLDDPDRECDHKCHLQLQGMGRRARDVRIENDRLKQDVIRADRADGFVLTNVEVEQGGYNNVNVVETNGFRLTKIVTRWAKNYGILTFTSDNGLYDQVEAYGSGDSGVYPGSGPEGHCQRYGIEVTRVNSYGNALGSSGTAGNGTWYHDNRFHDNAAGVALDSFAPGHPGMPQDCSKWTGNDIYSNNMNPFESDRDKYCQEVPFEKREKDLVCPQFIAVVGSGFMWYGANKNIVQNNRIYDNWRTGARLFWVPATLRGDNDPTHQSDTSNGNRYTDNSFGIAPDGSPAPNGMDVYWDEQGIGNCWESNKTIGDRGLTSDPAKLPDCASGGSLSPTSVPSKTAAEAPCVEWNPRTNPDPPGCAWFTTPPKPKG
jgi:hypothetical protein